MKCYRSKIKQTAGKVLRRYIFGSVLVVTVGVTNAGCSALNGDDFLPLLSSLLNHRMLVLLKGTYATDNPLDFSQINDNKLFVDSEDSVAGLIHPVDTGCAPFFDVNCLPRYSEIPIYLDIGELRLSSRNPLSDLAEIDSADASEKMWDVVSTERQVYCSQPYGIDFDINTCLDTGGVINFQEFMNGRGAVFPSRDVSTPIGNFWHAGVFVRGIAFGYGRLNGALTTDTFDNNDIIGSNITPLIQYDPNVDEVTQQLLPAQWFPLHHKVLPGQETSMLLDYSFQRAVLEIRFNIKENLMVHSFRYANDDVQAVVAFSDWRRGHAEPGSDDLGINMGGNVLTRARIYYPSIATELHLNGGVESDRHYYALYLSGEEAKDENLPIAATPVRNGSNKVDNLMPGSYVIQCRYDCNHDGYPETVLSEDSTFEIATGPGIASRSMPCGCGINSPASLSLTCDADPGCY